MNISPNFSPSIKIMKPYFVLSGFFYLLSTLWLFFIDPASSLSDFNLIGWVHLYMIGFVMMAIFSAMAQLGPIISEVKHYNVNIFKYLWMFLVVGLLLLMLGFYIHTLFLILGGVLVLIATSIYSTEFLMTLKGARRKTSITKAMKMSSLFLILGIISGLLMAAGFNGLIDINPNIVLKAHTFGLIVGFVIILIMGISIILIPMFGTAKRISDNEFTNSFITLSIGVTLMLLSPLFFTTYLEYFSYFFTITAIIFYFYQLFKMTKSRAKAVHDIWALSMYIAFISFVISFILLLLYMFNHEYLFLKLGMWIMFIGFFGFIIIGNLYKIIPFLVWFQVYSPLIEQRSVPMLHELLPQKLSYLQWLYSSVGLILTSIGIFFDIQNVFYGGVTFLFTGGVIFFIVINKTMKTNL